MTDAQNMLPKREALESLLTQGDVLLQLDPRVEGVQVPGPFRKQPLLVLRIGLDMPIPIPDLIIDDSGISATLSFDRAPQEVVLPWQAVFGMVTEQGQGLLWTADVPLEILDQMLEATADVSSDEADEADELDLLGSSPDSQAPTSPRPHLVALDGGLTDPESPPPSSPGDGPPSLRVIK